MIWAKPRAIDIVPSVTMSGGTLALATTMPLSMPQSRPATSATAVPTAAVDQPEPPIFSIVSAETTEEKTSTEAMDRSMPEVMMMKVMPTANTAQIARFWPMLIKLSPVMNWLGALMAKKAVMRTRTPRIQIDCIPLRRCSSGPCASPTSIAALRLASRAREM